MFPEISGKFLEISNFRKIYNPSCDTPHRSNDCFAVSRNCSIDLKPVHCYSQSVLEQQVYHTHTHIHDISHLKARLVEDWQNFDQKIKTGRSSSDTHIWAHVFEKEEDTLSISCSQTVCHWSCINETAVACVGNFVFQWCTFNANKIDIVMCFSSCWSLHL